MKISGQLDNRLIKFDLSGNTKEEVIKELVSLVYDANLIGNPEKVSKLVIDREELHPTGIGRKTAVPHARIENIDRVIVAAGIHNKGIDFKSRDGSKANVIFLMLAPEDDTTLYLQTLSSLAMLLMIGDLSDKLIECKSGDEFIKIFKTSEDL